MTDVEPDLVIEGLAQQVIEQRERIVELETDAATFRLLTGAAFDALRAEQQQHKWVRDDRDRLQVENRRLREEILLAGVEDADGVTL